MCESFGSLQGEGGGTPVRPSPDYIFPTEAARQPPDSCQEQPLDREQPPPGDSRQTAAREWPPDSRQTAARSSR